MQKTSGSSWLIFLLPVLALAGAAGIVWSQTSRIGDARAGVGQIEREIVAVEGKIKQIGELPPPPVFPTSEQTPTEQVDFLNRLRAYAAASGVKIDNFSKVTTTQQGPELATSEEERKKAPALPPGVTAISSGIEVSGRFAQINNFLYDLLKSPRLFNMTNVEWRRGSAYPNTQLSFTLIRYVTQPASPSGSPAPAEVTTETGASQASGVGSLAGE